MLYIREFSVAMIEKNTPIVGWALKILQSWGFEPELTRRGAIKLKLPGKDSSRARALTSSPK